MSKSIAKSKEGVEALGGMEDTLFLLDFSGSMDNSTDGAKVTKHAVLMESMEQMLRERIKTQEQTGDRTGVIRFGGVDSLPNQDQEDPDVALVFPIGEVSEYTIARLHTLRTGGGTPMFKALKLAIQHLDQSAQGLARLVIVSDGEPTDDVYYDQDLLTAEEAAAFEAEQQVAEEETLEISEFMKGLFDENEEVSKNEAIIRLAKKASDELGIAIDTVGVSGGGEHGYDGDFMRKLAEVGEGEFYEVSSKAEVANLLMKLEKERRELLGKGMLLLGPGSQPPLPPKDKTGTD